MSDAEFYKELSNYEKLTMILTTSLNSILDSVSFGTYTRVILAVRNNNEIDFYLWQNGYEVGCFTRSLDPTITYDEEDVLYLINTLCAETDSPEYEEDRRIPMARAMSLGYLDGKAIYIIPTACNEGFPKGLLWQKIYEFFVEGWSEIIEDIEEHPLFDYSSPQETIDYLYFEWDWTTVACCRALHEGGFYTGYGDPYESEFLFGIINDMSALNYEKRQSKGTIVAIPEEVIDKQSLLVRLTDNIPIDDKLSKTYRKLLEMTSEKVALAFGDFQVLGLVDSSLFEWKVVFYGFGKWKYYFKDQVIFTVENGKIIIGKEAAQISYHLPEEDKVMISNPAVVEIVVQEAMKQGHGTCILFTDNAAKEASRLAKYRRCIQIEAVNLSEHSDIILPLSAIDGAIISDFDGNCYGVGAILDGEAQYAGDYGRGSRYNSAINYVGWKKENDREHEYCAVVISEDGIHDIIATKTLEQIEDNLNDPFSNG